MHILAIMILLAVGVLFTLTSVIDGLFRFMMLPFKGKVDLDYKIEKKIKFSGPYKKLNKEFMREITEKINFLRQMKNETKTWKVKSKLKKAIKHLEKIREILRECPNKIVAHRIEIRNISNSISDVIEKYVKLESNVYKSEKTDDLTKETAKVLDKTNIQLDDLHMKIFEEEIIDLENEIDFTNSRIKK